MTDDELAEIIRTKAKELDEGTEATLAMVAETFRAIVPRGQPHRGKQNMTRREVLEWYAGELVDIHDRGGLFAVNSWINCADKFTK